MALRNRFSQERKRRRQRVITRAVTLLVIVAGLAVLGWSAYLSGTELARLDVRDLERRNEKLTSERDDSRAEGQRLRTDLDTARRERDELRRRYDAEVPAGQMAELYGLVRQRLTKGVDAARLAQVLREVAATRDCDTRSSRRRFAIQLAATRDPEPAVFLDGLVAVVATIPAAGTPTKNATVLVQTAWADDPVKLNGLPVRYDVVINNAALHLTVDASDVPGYAVATLSTCGKGS